MASKPIQAVLFDMGGTLEDLYYDEAIHEEATRGLQALLAERDLDPHLDPAELQAVVLSGMKAYQAWREASEVELPPESVWANYILAEHGLPRERLMAAAEDLTFFYETHYHVRRLRPEAPGLLDGLQRRGLRLGIISNVVSRRLVHCKLDEYGIAAYFGPAVTSSNFCWRKPNERIFVQAARLLDLDPAACAYVGDTLSRDIAGARRAGYGLAIQIKSFLTDKVDRGTASTSPDAVVQSLSQVLEIVTAAMETAHAH